MLGGWTAARVQLWPSFDIIIAYVGRQEGSDRPAVPLVHYTLQEPAGGNSSAASDGSLIEMLTSTLQEIL
jgi:hypothetical protein